MWFGKSSKQEWKVTLKKKLFYYTCMPLSLCGGQRTTLQSVFPFYPFMGPGHWTQVARLVWKEPLCIELSCWPQRQPFQQSVFISIAVDSCVLPDWWQLTSPEEASCSAFPGTKSPLTLVEQVWSKYPVSTIPIVFCLESQCSWSTKGPYFLRSGVCVDDVII